MEEKIEDQELRNRVGGSQLKTEIIQELYDLSVESTSHGIPRIIKSAFRKEWTITAMWSIVFTGCFVYCIYTLVLVFNTYYSYGVTSTISKFENLPATFPAVTICNINPFNEAYAGDYILNKSSTAKCFDYSNSSNFVACMNITDPYLAFGTFNDQIKRIVANDKTLTAYDHFWYGYDLQTDMTISCQYNGIPCNVSNNFIQYWDNQYGNCYTFNTDGALKTSSTGDGHGLEMELVCINSTGGTRYALYQGIHLVVHNQSDSPFALNSGITIKAGAKSYVGVNRQFTNKLNGSFSNCLTDLIPVTGNSYSSTLFSYFNQLNVTYYDQKFCYNLCYQDKLIKKCGCADIIVPTLNNADYCDTYKTISCLKDFASTFTISDIKVLCENACPQECNTIEYSLTVTTSGFPAMNYLKILQSSAAYSSMFPQNVSDSDLLEFARQGFLKLIINYENPYFTSIDESPAMDSQALFGFLGGQLGLFIGISVLSMAEFFELIIKVLYVVHKHRKIKKSMLESALKVPTLSSDSSNQLFNNSVSPVESLTSPSESDVSSRYPSHAVTTPNNHDLIQFQIMRGNTEIIKMD